MSKLGDEPAYPTDDDVNGPTERGITKRELFAAMAMQGMLANPMPQEPSPVPQDEVATMAALVADALLAELAKTQE